MTVEVDVSALQEKTYFRDKKCEEVEAILRTSSDFELCVVKRFRQIKEFEGHGHPFDIKDSDGKHLVWLFKHEVDALEDSEMVVFARVQKDREMLRIARNVWFFLAFSLGFIGVWGVGISIVGGTRYTLSSLFFSTVLLVSSLVLLSAMSIVLINRRITEKRLRNIDIKYASEDVFFLKALQKLAPLSDPNNELIENYDKRLTVVKDDLKDF